MNRTNYLLSFLFFYFSSVSAQDIIVTVTPVQQVLPPHVLMYVADPGNYFTITLTNTAADTRQVYLGMEMQQVMNPSDLYIVTPPKRQPQSPFVVPANGSYVLSVADMKRLFDHIPSSEISAPQNLFTDYSNGAFGLLPEGDYLIRMTAYKWDPSLASPVVMSDPASGQCIFTVCYNAQPPEFLTPLTNFTGEALADVAAVDVAQPLFTWRAPIVPCNATASRYHYTFRMVELLPNQKADYAIDNNPVVYEVSHLMVPQCMLPQQVVTGKMRTDRTYVARVTAYDDNTASTLLNFTTIGNRGKSDLKVFRLKTDMAEDAAPEDEKEASPAENKAEVIMGKGYMEEDISDEALYTFRNPKITLPHFDEEAGARKQFFGSLIVEWIEPAFVGGEGTEWDKLQFKYEVQLYDGKQNADREQVMKGEPIYTKTVSDTRHEIAWDDISEQVTSGDYLLLRVLPVCESETSIYYSGDQNVVDFGMMERLSRKYFQCSNMITIENTEPTTLSAKELKGRRVTIGEYELTLDEVKGSATDGFSGKGRVWWSPLGFDIGVCVKFDHLELNTDEQVIEGTAVTYAEDQQSNLQVVEKLFSDWGIDELIGESGLSCANALQEGASNTAKGLAEQLDISQYYKYIRTGTAIKDLLTKGRIEQLYMPLGLPEDINQSPADIQIVGMKFAPTHATMDIMAEFVIDDCSYTDNEILVFGLPRVCISPNRLLPEGGTLALLRDFTVKDPGSTYTCTFKAPNDLLQPTNGCYLSWADNKFERLGIDLDMSIPGLKKEVNGVLTAEQPSLHIQTMIESWDAWIAPDISMDDFQVDDLPGWTFSAEHIVIDHHETENSQFMGSFPKGYDKKKTFTGEDDAAWMGVYIKKLAVKFPKALELGETTDGQRRFSIAATDMFFDKSGATLSVDANELLSAKTGSFGGWAFTLDNVGLSFIQNDFTNCRFSGTFDVPLIEGSIGYACNVYKLQKTEQNEDLQYAYIFKTQQVDNLSLDFLLAKANFSKQHTYLLVEAAPDGGKLKTKVELLMGGTMAIGGDMLKEMNVPGDFSLPDIAFSQLRIANCRNTWVSNYEQSLQDDAKKKLGNTSLISNYEYEVVKDKCYIGRGAWSLASASKRLGPFEFSLKKFDFEYDKKTELLTLTPSGKVAIVEGIDLSAEASLTIKAVVKNVNDLSNLSIEYKELVPNNIEVNSTFADCVFKGTLHQESGESEGYIGSMEFRLPGDLLIVEANAAYYTQDKGKASQYTWGFLKAKVGSKTGIEITPIKITSITGGFYFNCMRADNDLRGATPQKGLIGAVVGIGLATTAGESALSGDFEMTCIYDKDLNGEGKGGLTSFVFNGHMQAVDGMVDADASIVYCHNQQDQYLALNVTVDAKCDAGELATKIKETTEKFEEKLDKLKEKGYKLVSGVSASLADKIGDNDGESGDDRDMSATYSSGGHVALDFRITFKEKGQQLSKCKWHVYVGEPGDGKNPEADEKKRCYFHLIDFKSRIATVKIGANAYLCIGNELPNNGRLPDIPYKVSRFLDGKSQGAGVQSASKSEADLARQKALDKVLEQAASGCGVMLGATAYGYINLDFGLLYGNFDATAGFDIALTKFSTPQPCPNYGGNMGFHDWYGQGQLYASLEADLGLRLNLGFFNDSISILKGGLGGCFRFMAPNPSYFTGEARCYLSLFNGLVDIDRTYEFECGTFCTEFHGNPLDDFELFGDFIGYDNSNEGWREEKNYINPKLTGKPILRTNAPIREYFRLLDENELDRIAQKTGQNRALLEAQASRTFVFKMNSTVRLRRYDKNGFSDPWKETVRNANGTYSTKTYYYKDIPFMSGRNIKGVQHILDLLDLDANKRYMLEVSGYAKEVVNGVEVNPVTYNTKTGKYVNKAWNQTKYYYFRTSAEKEIEDVVDLQEYVAIAYPSYYNKLKYDTEYIKAHRHDVLRPRIALTEDLSGKVFKNGTLQWTWLTDGEAYPKKTTATVTAYDYADKDFNMQCRFCTVASNGPASNATVGQKGRLRLEYIVSRSEKGKVVRDTTTLVNLKLYIADDGDWRTSCMDYEKPFVGLVSDEIKERDYANNYNSDKGLFDGNLHAPSKNLYRTFNPYWYIGYLTNLVFPGGYEMDSWTYNLYATTSQSLLYTDKGGHYTAQMSREQKIDGQRAVSDAYSKIRRLSWYTYDDFKDITPYPLPYLRDHAYNYVRGGDSRLSLFYPSATKSVRVTNLCADLRAPYTACASLQKQIASAARELQTVYNNGYNEKVGIVKRGVLYGAKKVVEWNNNKVGCFITAKSGSTRLELPYYQITVAWSATWPHATLHNMYKMLPNLVASSLQTHWRAENKEYGNSLWFRLFGGKDENGKVYAAEDKFTFGSQPYSAYWRNRDISEVKARAYRVNAYDLTTGRYWLEGPYNNNGSYDANKFKQVGTVAESYTIKLPLQSTYDVK